VLCLSDQLESRERSGVFEELDIIAEELRQFPPNIIYLIPVRLSACTIPHYELGTGRYLDQLQYVDLFPAKTREQGFSRLLDAIRSSVPFRWQKVWLPLRKETQ
jgi:hypothetical protein